MSERRRNEEKRGKKNFELNTAGNYNKKKIFNGNTKHNQVQRRKILSPYFFIALSPLFSSKYNLI
jgi:hypothetical protein